MEWPEKYHPHVHQGWRASALFPRRVPAVDEASFAGATYSDCCMSLRLGVYSGAKYSSNAGQDKTNN